MWSQSHCIHSLTTTGGANADGPSPANDAHSVCRNDSHSNANSSANDGANDGAGSGPRNG